MSGLAEKLLARVEVVTADRSVDGYGYGDGSGYGYGYGDGYGCGSGYGYGGSGYGYGDGSGDGSGYGYGYGYGYGDGYGDGSGYGYGCGCGYWISAIPNIVAAWSAPQRARFAAAIDEGAVIAYWRSHADGTPSNGGRGKARTVGGVEQIAGPLALCGARALHATLEPGRWKGSKVWVVALFGEVAYDSDGQKVGSLHREVLGVAWEEAS